MTMVIIGRRPGAPPGIGVRPRHPPPWDNRQPPFLPQLEEFLASKWNSRHYAGNPAPNSGPYPMIPYFPDIPAGDKVEHSPAILSLNQ